MFLTPETPISPHEAGMQAAMDSMAGGSYSPQQQQQVGQSASRAAQMAGKYGGIAAMLGSGLKNIYDSSISGQAPSLSGMATGAYGAQQFIKPLATRAGAQYGAKVGVREAGRPQGDIDREIQESMADYTQGQQGEFDTFVRDPILPRTAEGVAEQAAEQLREGSTPGSIGRAGLNVTHSMRPEFQGFGNMFDAVEQEQLERDNRTRGNVGYLDQRGRRTFGGSSAGYRDALNRPQPSELVSVTRAPPTPMSTGRARNVLAGRTRPPIDTGGFDASAPPTGEGEQTSMADFGAITGGFASKVNESLKQQQEEQMKEQQEKQEEERKKKEEMNQEQQAKLTEELRDKTNMQSTGA